MSKRRVVVTGLGAVTPIGNTVPEYWQNLINGRNGIDYITKFDTEKFDVRFAGEVKNLPATDYLNPKEIRRMDNFTVYALVSAHQAYTDSQINLESADLDRIGVVYGSGIGGIRTLEQQNEAYLAERNPRVLSPFFVTMMIADIAAGQISIRYGLRGPNYSTTSACATSAHSIADAFMLIQRGNADAMFCGGAEASITELSIGGFSSMRALSNWNDRPKEASRPFDKDRSGFVMGEGGATLVLEELEHAKARGAKIYCELAGVGLTADAHHITAPDPEGRGAVRSMQEAIKDAGMMPEDLDYINAHGTSTPLNDVTETRAIKTVFGEHAYKLTVSSVKSMTGHLLGAAGAIESVATVLSVQNDIIPPTINLDNPDPLCDLDYSAKKLTKRKVRAALKNTFGFGGHNASLLFKKYEA